MKIYRFMSMKEFQMVTAGCEIVGGYHKARTSSYGVCFLPEKIKIDEERTFDPESSIRFLSGIVCDDVLVEFNVIDPKILNESWGVYADPDYYYSRIIIDELCCAHYSINQLVPTRYAVMTYPYFGCAFTWYNVN